MTDPRAADWHLRITSDPVEAHSVVRPLTARDPIAYSVVASVTASLVEDPSRYESYEWFILDYAGEDQLVCLHTHPLPIYLPHHVPGALGLLVAELIRTGHPLAGVNGDRQAVEAFVAAYTAKTGSTIDGCEGMGVFDLPRAPKLPWHVAGARRLATSDDTDLVAGWIEEFMIETGGGGPATGAETAHRHIARRLLRLWTHDAAPVAMCWTSPPAAGVVRVSGVYTPPAHRGHGFASALVEAVSREEQQRGHQCMLFTQLANPTSNKIYQALGYRHRFDQLHVGFTSGP